MEMTEKTISGFEIPPLRTLDDFLLGSARFQLPNVKDMEKWGNRVVNNLLYYQTNYFLLGVFIFLIVSVLHPVKMATVVVIAPIAPYLVAHWRNELRLGAKSTRIVVGAVTLVTLYFINYLVGCFIVLAFGILLPVSVAFIHASLRLRNIKNKIVNKIAGSTMRKTPMGTFLVLLGLDDFYFKIDYLST